MITILNAAFLLGPSTDQTLPPETFPAPEPPAPDYAPALAIIGRLAWRSARAKDRWGKPQVPHQYTVRQPAHPEAEADYVALFRVIEEHGRIEKYGRHKRYYLYPGDGRKYWRMTDDISESRIINRMLVIDDIERLRKTGQL